MDFLINTHSKKSVFGTFQIKDYHFEKEEDIYKGIFNYLNDEEFTFTKNNFKIFNYSYNGNVLEGEFFICNNNKLISLKGCPAEIGMYFDCSYNHLESLEGAPLMVEKEFHCNENLKRFKRKDLPDSIVVKGKFYGIKDTSVMCIPYNLKKKKRI